MFSQQPALRILLSFIVSFLSCNATVFAKASKHDDFILTPIPKAGTHLIMRTVHLMTGKGVIGVVGGTKEDFLKSLEIAKQQNAILKCHHYSGDFTSAISKLGYKNVFVCRDPRDACVSLVVYLDKMNGKKRDFFTVPDEWDTLSFDDKLYAVIVGNNCSSYMKTWFERLANWSKHPGSLVVRFEDLVGENGGGSNQVQLQTLIDIAAYTNMNIRLEELEKIADDLYKPTSQECAYEGITYTPGQIGNWRLFFNKKNKQLFKKAFNHLLVQFGYEANTNW